MMEEIKSMLHLDVMTVTGKTLGENLEDLKKNGFYDKCDEYCAKVGLKWQDIIRPFDHAIGTNGAIAILKGNLAPEGAVIKHTACPKEMFEATLPYSSASKDPRAAACRRCSTPRKPFPPTRSWAKPSP